MADDEQHKPGSEGPSADADDTAADDADEPERVTPEVVSDGAAPVPPGPTDRVVLYRMVRIGLTLLIAIGALVAISSVSLLTDPDGFVCRSARTLIENELDEDEPDPAVAEIDPDDVDDLDCDNAVETADRFTDDVPEESTATTIGVGALVAGVLMIGAGGYALSRRTRRARNIALGVAALGIIPSSLFGLGMIGLLIMGFVVYAIGFSRDAKAAFGVVGGGSRTGGGGGGLFRPRTPPPTPSDPSE